MRTQEAPRDPSEQFYFDQGELVVVESAIKDLGRIPSVNFLEGSAIVLDYQDLADYDHTVGIMDISGPRELPNGYKINRITTGPDRPQQEYSDEKQEWEFSLRKIAAEHEVEAGDLLIANAKNPGVPKQTLIIPADESFPREPYSSYAPMGVIDQKGTLNTWSMEGREAKYLTELLVAAKLTSSRLDNAQLDRQLGDTVLFGRLATRDLGRTYIEWFEDKFGGGYLPPKEPKDRWDEFPEPLTASQRDLLHR